MNPYEDLIRRLQAPIADRQRATGGVVPAPRPFPPVAAEALQASERAIGFKLPELLRTIYLTVGNGGFGPKYGIVGIKGGATVEGVTLEVSYQSRLNLEKENCVWRWPLHLLPLVNYGCGMWSCIDCTYQKLPMILWDPNNLDADLDAADAQLNWRNSFWDQQLTFKNWLEGWLANKEQPEPKWPSDSWMRKRLGFSLPK